MIGLVFMICFFIGFFVFMSVGKINKYKRIMRKTDMDIQGLVKKYNIDRWSKDWEQYSWKLKVIKNIFDDRRIWVPVFTELSRMIPEKSAIQRLEYRPEKEELEVVLHVLAEAGFEMQRINQFLEMSKRSKSLPSGAKIVDQKKGELKGKALELFKLSISFSKRQKEAAPKKKKKAGH